MSRSMAQHLTIDALELAIRSEKLGPGLIHYSLKINRSRQLNIILKTMNPAALKIRVLPQWTHAQEFYCGEDSAQTAQ